MELPKTLEFPVIIKILKKEFVDDLLDGKLYMNNLKYFVDLEKNTGQRGVGDIREASLVNIRKHELFIQYDSGEEIKIDLKPAPGIVYNKEALFHPVFCAVGKIFSLEYKDNNKYVGNISLPEETLKDFISNEAGEYKAVVIFNYIDFLERINNKKIPAKTGFIKYRDMKFPNIIDGKLCSDDTYTKDLRFRNQSEYRIELFIHSEEAYVLDIGDIRKLSFVMDCKKLVSGFSVTETIEPNEVM